MGVFPLLAISTSSLADGKEGVPYSDTFGASGGNGTFTWAISTGILPAGLTLQAGTGSITGTPTTVEQQGFSVVVESGDGQSAEGEFTIDVSALVLLPNELCSQNPSTAHVTFADGNLETTVRQELGVPSQTALTCALVSTLTGLNAGAAGIVDLAGVQNLVGLKQAYLVGNSIADLTPLASMTQLEGLNLSGNPLASLTPLSGLIDLDTFIAEGSQVSDITPLAGLVAIEQLELDNNSIDDISALSGLAALRVLDLHDNDLSDIGPLSTATGLTWLDLRSNAITDVGPLAGLTALDNLVLSFNSIADVGPLSGLTALASLNLAFNDVTDIAALAGMSGLTYLNVQNNSIADIAAVASMSALQTLVATGNDLTDISPLAGLGSLTWVSLDSNANLDDIQALIDNPGIGTGDVIALWATEVTCAEISALEGTGATVQSDCLTPFEFCGTNSVAIATFEDTVVESAVRTALGLTTDDPLRCGLVQGLTSLDLSSAGVTSVAGIQNATGLTTLTLSDNGLTDISWLNRLTALVDLALDQNDVTDLTSLRGLTSLSNVDLSDNASLSDVQPLLDNTGFGAGDSLDLLATAVACSDVDALRTAGVTVTSTCP
jgi:Leucine-rich repeat (LRR) protein